MSSQTAQRGKLGFILPPLQLWAVLGLPEVSQRWGKGWKERKEISTCMLSVQETVQVQGRKGCLNRGAVLADMEEPLGLVGALPMVAVLCMFTCFTGRRRCTWSLLNSPL